MENSHRTQTQILISSSISSFLSTLITNPIEVAKLKLQYAPTECSRFPHSSFIQLYKCSSCSSFSFADTYRGLSVVLPQLVTNNILYMQLYEFQRKKYSTYLSSTWASFYSAVVSRVIVTTLLVPLQALRVRISNQVQKKQLAKNQKGFKITMVRDVVYSSIFWPAVEEIRNFIAGRQYRYYSKANKHEEKYFANIMAGIIAGGFVAGITTPLDTLKTRIQSGVEEKGTIRSQLMEIYKKEGNLGLFSGVHFRVMKTSIHSALYLIFYEKFLREFEGDDF